ncbi:hypothetical protein V3C99_008505 [Haemonchus contortus]
MPPNCTKRLYGAEEMRWDHWQMPTPLVYQGYLLFAAVCIGLASWNAYQELPIDTNNFAENLDRIMRDRSKWTNDTLYMSEIVDSLEPTHPLHLLYNKTIIRYDYGSTYHNYCELRRRPENSLPSLLRVMEMKVITQTFLRAIVLNGLLFKFLLCMVQARVIDMLPTRGAVLWFLSRVSPFLQIASSSVLMFVLCLQQDQDGELRWIMRFHIPLFCVLFLAHASLYSFLEIARRRTCATLTLFILRIIGLGVFAISAPAVYEAYIAYLTFKPCHTNVPISAAICEYLCISVVVLFALSQICDYGGLVMNLVAMRCDTLPRKDLPDYSPAFMTSKFDSAPFAQLRRQNVHCNDLKSSSSSS